MKSIFEQNGGTYTRCGDYLLPENRQGLYTRLILSGNLMEHLQKIDATCRRRMDQMIREMALTEGVTEELKAKEQMTWVRKMNSLHASAEEIVLKELVYA